jgi:predicted metal-binding membrane protein
VTTVASSFERVGRGVPRPVIVAIAAAWAIAVAAEVTGHSRALHLHSTIEGGPPLWAALLLFLVAWQAMLAGMMLPSSLPLIRLFEVVSRRREDGAVARAAFLGGYVAVWTAFGALAFVGDVGLHRAVDTVPWLAERPWLLAGSVLAVAGAFQFSELKERCLAKCRAPGPYMLAHYRRGPGGGFTLGLGHGLFCLGCCWALMLVMFGVGVAALWMMAALTALMVYEKIGRYGAASARVAGVALLAAAVVQLAHPSWLPAAVGGPRSFASRIALGPGSATRVVHRNGYRLELRLEPNRALRPGVVRLELSKDGRAVSGARVRATFTMLDMQMEEISTRIPQTDPGTYARSGVVLAMPGRWGAELDVTPPRGEPFAVRLVDHVRE